MHLRPRMPVFTAGMQVGRHGKARPTLHGVHVRPSSVMGEYAPDVADTWVKPQRGCAGGHP